MHDFAMEMLHYCTKFYMFNVAAFSHVGEILPAKANLLSNCSCLGKEYHLELEYFVTMELNDGKWRNALHLTTGANNDVYGSRTPAIWLRNNTLYVSSAVNGNKNYKIQLDEPLEEDNWLKLDIDQFVDSTNKVINGFLLNDTYLIFCFISVHLQNKIEWH